MRVEATLRRAVVARPGGGGAPERGNAFSVVVNNDASPAASTQESAAAEGIGALLALQAVDDPLTGRRRALKGGRALLDALDELQIALLDGQLPADGVERLASAIGALAPSGDPALDEVLSEIDLRARVELAKLGRFPK